MIWFCEFYHFSIFTKDIIPIMKKGKQLPRNILSPMEDYTDDEEDSFTNYKISPIDDEESHIYARIGKPPPYMIQRFQQQPLPSSQSISSLESTGSHNLSSLDSANGFSPNPNPEQQKKPFTIKNLYVRPPERLGEDKAGAKQTKFHVEAENVADNDDDNDDDQYVTLLPTAQRTLPSV